VSAYTPEPGSPSYLIFPVPERAETNERLTSCKFTSPLIVVTSTWLSRTLLKEMAQREACAQGTGSLI